MKNFGLVYGLGDGGGGPIREEIIILKNMASRFPKHIKFTTALDYFKKIEEHSDKIPIWNDEMYLEQHRGCYTSHVWLKEFNRKAEIMFYQLESLISLLQPFGLTFNNEKIKKNWLQVLFNQFHDILPGSSIPEVYNDTRIDFRDVFGNLQNYLKKSLNYLSSKINSSGDGILVYNSLPFERKTLIELENETNSSLMSSNGDKIPVQESNGKSLFQVNLPPMGYTILKKGAMSKEQNTSDLKIDVENSNVVLENKHLIVHVSKKTGDISKVFSKDLKKDVLKGKGNVVQIFMEDSVAFFAWNIDKQYAKKQVFPEFKSISIIENGPVRIGVKVKKTYKEQSIIQNIFLNSDSPRVDMELNMKFYVKKAMVKVAFPIDMETHDVHAEIPYGIISRKSKPENEFHEAQWEQNCQKFVSFSENGYSVSLLNSGRYAYDVKYHEKFKNVLRLTILRTPNYPRGGSPLFSMFPSGNWHEQDEFFTKYSLLISKGDYTNPEIKQQALGLNVTPLIQEVKNTKGDLPEDLSFLDLNPSNVFLSAIKLPEDSEKKNDTIILRCYEALGKDSKCVIKFNDKYTLKNVEEVDLLELNPVNINSFDAHSLQFDIKKFEIKTFKITFS